MVLTTSNNPASAAPYAKLASTSEQQWLDLVVVTGGGNINDVVVWKTRGAGGDWCGTTVGGDCFRCGKRLGGQCSGWRRNDVVGSVCGRPETASWRLVWK